MVANLNLLEMLIVLAELEAEDFRQAPNICNVLGTMQSNNTEKIQRLTLRILQFGRRDTQLK